MLEKIIKDYFSFSRKERTAIIVLAFLIIFIALLPYLIPEPDNSLDKMEAQSFELQRSQSVPLKESQEITAHGKKNFAPIHDRESHFESTLFKTNKPSRQTALFYFDPNTVSAEDWKKLGLRDRTITTIQNYLVKGGSFKKKEDIERIYGLPPDEAKRLMPYIRIAGVNPVLKPDAGEKAYTKNGPMERSILHKDLTSSLIDINTADSLALIALPGIGSKLTARILHFREKLGGFYSVEQLSEIYGLPDSTFRKIKPRLIVAGSIVPSININTIEADQLKQHPYIRWDLAAAIVEYRRQHGNYSSLDELHKINIVTDEIYKKIIPYLKIE